MRKVTNYSIIFLITIAQPAFARIGETKGECTKRYGKPFGTTENSALFYKPPFLIQVEFYNKVVINIQYYKVEKSKLGPRFTENIQNLTTFEIDTLLHANSTSEWKLNNLLGIWSTSDDKLQAAVDPSTGGILRISDIEKNKNKAKLKLSEF